MVDDEKRTGSTGYYFADKRRIALIDCPEIDNQWLFSMQRELQSHHAVLTGEYYEASNEQYEAGLLKWLQGGKVR